MKNKGVSSPVLWMVVAIVVFIAALAVSLWWTQLTKGQVPWLFEVLEQMLKNLLGITGPQNDLTNAIKCAHYRCVEGCQEVKKTDFGSFKCLCREDIEDVDSDGKICNEEQEMFPVELTEFQDTFVPPSVVEFKIDNIEFVCMLDSSSYLKGGVIPLEDVNWLWVTDDVVDTVERDFCSLSLFGLAGMENAIKSVDLSGNIYIRTHQGCAPGYGGAGDCITPGPSPPFKDYTTMIEGKTTSRYVTLTPDKLSKGIQVAPTTSDSYTYYTRFVIKKTDNTILDWVVFLRLDRDTDKFVLKCSDGTPSDIRLEINKGTLICNNKFVIVRTTESEIKLRYVGEFKRFSFSPSTVTPGDDVSAYVMLDSSYINKNLQLRDRCPDEGPQGTTFAECVVSRLQPTEPPSCELHFTVTSDTPSYLVLCEGSKSTGFFGVLNTQTPTYEYCYSDCGDVPTDCNEYCDERELICDSAKSCMISDCSGCSASTCINTDCPSTGSIKCYCKTPSEPSQSGGTPPGGGPGGPSE